MKSFVEVRTAFGTLAVVYGEHGVARIVLPRTDWGEVNAAELAPALEAATPPPAIRALARALQRHLVGEVQDFSGVALDTGRVPPFHMRVLRAAQRIPPGQTRSYGEVASLAGSPRAARAVGRAMATNPWPIVVPCHRVFGRAGFGEYSAGAGVQTKLRLLWREGYRGRTSNVAFDEHAAMAHLRACDARLRKLIDRVGPFTLQAVAPHALGSWSDEDIIDRLTRHHGVGLEHAQMLLLLYFGRPNVVPASETLLQRGFTVTYGVRANAKAIAEAAREWTPYASVASWYLLRAGEIGGATPL